MTSLTIFIRKYLLSTSTVFFISSSTVYASNDNTIEFKRGAYSTVDAKSVITKGLSNTEKSQITISQRQYKIIQFDELPSDDEKAELVEQGIVLLDYISDKAYWAKVNNDFRLSEKWASSFKLWTPPDEVKVSMELEKAINSDSNNRFDVVAVFHQGASKPLLEKKLNDNGVLSEINWVGDTMLRLSTDRNAIINLIQFDDLKWIEQQAPETSVDNATAAQRIKVDKIRSAPLSLTGEGITIGIWDSGAADTHGDYNGRVTVLTNQNVRTHTTRITGTAIGDGTGNSVATGMAPKASVRNWSFNDVNYENDLINEAQNSLIDLANFSFSTPLGWSSSGSDSGGSNSLFGFYSAEASIYDSIIHDHGLLIFKVAGNNRDDCRANVPTDCDGDEDGFDSIPHRSVAKNLVTIGATDDDDNISVFTGWGPADDGRIKPDLCANGTSITTTDHDTPYATSGGTSFSTPSAAGAAALLLEHYNNLYEELPTDPALIKGLMIHSAAEFGSQPGPDPMCGWGLIDAQKAAQLISQEAFITGNVVQGADQTPATIYVPQNTGQVKVTLAWTDPEGNPSASIALVNNLDLRLIDSNGNEHLPWRLDSTNGYRTAVRGDNTRDNIEQITIDNPPAGNYSIRILAGSIPSGPQDYVLISEFIGNSTPSKTEEICFPIKQESGELSIVCL